MIFRPKGRDDCCCKSWKDKINELWEKYQGVVKGVKAGSVTAYPDGDGIADLDGAVADAIAQQVPPMLTDLVTETELSTALEDYPTETELSQTLEDYATKTDLETKQDVLVSGETIRTINGRDLLGEGNLKFLEIADLKTINGESLLGPGDVDVVSPAELNEVVAELRQEIANIKMYGFKASSILAEVSTTANPRRYIAAKIPATIPSNIHRNIIIETISNGGSQPTWMSFGINETNTSVSRSTGGASPTFRGYGLAYKNGEYYLYVMRTSGSGLLLFNMYLKSASYGSGRIDMFDDVELMDTTLIDDSYEILYENSP